jgi:predicted phosphodiesterase
MRLLIISDIHANLAAFEAVLKDAHGLWDQIWCLGDLVGYGPDPNECVALLREYDHLSLCGNHDWAVLGKLDINNFNEEAQTAIDWTRKQLSEETRIYLDGLQAGMLLEPFFTLAHASPRHPVWEYILDKGTAVANLSYFDTPYCLVGHTHAAVCFTEVGPDTVEIQLPLLGETISLGADRLILNPGSVGQPRDADPRAAYALLESDKLTWEFRRIAYPIKETQERMRRYGLPHRLVARLEYGW